MEGKFIFPSFQVSSKSVEVVLPYIRTLNSKNKTLLWVIVAVLVQMFIFLSYIKCNICIPLFPKCPSSEKKNKQNITSTENKAEIKKDPKMCRTMSRISLA